MSIFKNKEKEDFFKELSRLSSNHWDRLTMQSISDYTELKDMFYKQIKHLGFFQRKSSKGIIIRYILTVLLFTSLFISLSIVKHDEIKYFTIISYVIISGWLAYVITEFKKKKQEIFLRRKELAELFIPMYKSFRQELLNEITLCENIIERKMNPTMEDIKIYLEQDKVLVYLKEIMSDEQLENFWNKTKENFCKDQKTAIMHNKIRIELIDEEIKFLESIK